MEGIAMLNIPSIYGGSNLWGDTVKVKKRKKVAGEADRECSSGSMSSADLSVTVQGRRDFYLAEVSCFYLLQTIHLVKNLICRERFSFIIQNLSPDMGDKLIEVVGLMNTLHMARVKGGIHSGERLAQCSTVTIQYVWIYFSNLLTPV